MLLARLHPKSNDGWHLLFAGIQAIAAAVIVGIGVLGHLVYKRS